MKLSFDWQVSSFFGWGVYGLNLALECARRGVEVSTTHPIASKLIEVDALARRALRPFVKRSAHAAPADAVLLQALGNDFLPERPAGCRVGVIFFETPLSPAAIARAKEYDLIITGSRWNEAQLRDAGVDQVKTILQGIDPSLFHPAPKRKLFPDRFLIFSGGKAEPRKGQDIVLKAFRIFAAHHPDAMLITAWHSPWPHLAAGMDLDLSGIADRVIDVGPRANATMAQVYRECDVALFPNRAEGGTNLVAMETMACGVPTLLSARTGHQDLLAFGGRPLGQYCSPGDEPSEAAAMLEYVYNHQGLARQVAAVDAEAIATCTWSDTVTQLLVTLESLHERHRQADGREAAA